MTTRATATRVGPILAFVAAMFAGPAFAISERNYATDYARLVIPYYETGTTDTFTGAGGVSISYRVFNGGPDSPAIVILPGQSEPYRKYAELIADLGSRGYSTYIIDHRGQGANDRLTPFHDLSHVDNFDDYVADVETFISNIVLADKHRKLFLLAHSMGGTIAAIYISRHPKVFDAVVLSSPMFEINTKDRTASYAYFGSMWKVLTGNAADPVDGLDNYRYDPTVTVDRSTVTSSAKRWDMNRQIIRENPNLALGGVSYGWLYNALIAIAYVDQLGSKLEVPLLIFRAGRDQVVKTGQYDWYCSFRPQLCTVVSEPFIDAQHEILQERDSIRDKAIDLILRHFH